MRNLFVFAALLTVSCAPKTEEQIRWEERADNVTILDFRIDKVFNLGGKYRFTGMLDIGNLLNSNPENNFIVTTGSRFGDIIEWLPGRTFKIGVRFTF